MKNITFFVLFFIFSGIFYSQNIVIQWNGTETADFGTLKMTLPKFSNEGYRFEENSIYLNLRKPAAGKKVRITNQQWQKITSKDLYDLAAEHLPKSDRISISYYNDLATNSPVYNARISTFKNEKGTLFRLNSFDIVEDNGSTTARSATLPTTIGIAENPLKSGTFYKIKVDKSGIFKITKKFLADNGISTNNINPKNFRIYGNGGLALPEDNSDPRYAALQENAIQVVGEEDGVWNDNDYALFYAQGPNGFNIYNSKLGTGKRRKETRSDASFHFQNIYEDYAYYFINFDIGPGKRVQPDDTALPASLITRYDEYQYLDEEKNNLLKLGRVWVGDAFTSERKITFNTRSPILPEDSVYYRASAVGFKSLKNSVKFSINGANESTATLTGNTDYEKIHGFGGTVKGLSGNVLTITVTPNIAPNPNGVFYLDYAEVVYKQDLTYNDSQMNFRFYDIVEGSGTPYGFSLTNAATAEQVWDVSDITNAKKKTNQSGTKTNYQFSYTASGNFSNEFVAFKNSAAYTPTFVAKIEKQDLASIQNIDYLIITRKDLMGEAKRMADYHQKKNNYRTAVVDIDQIYNEYSSGSRDITAVRDFVSSLKNEKGGLKYLLLIGDTSFDFRGRYSNTDNIIPSYQSEESGNFVNSFVTDDYFVMTDAQEIDPKEAFSIYNYLPNLPVGRLPASNSAEAKLLVDKTLAYYNALPGQSSPFGEWRMKLDFVVDNDADNKTPFHKIIEGTIKDNFELNNIRREYNIRKLYLASFPGEASAGGVRIPQINQAISNDVGNSLYLFYFGHGGINGWAQERVLTTDMIQNFNNFTSVYSRFPFVSTITCEFTLWDNPEVNSAGEQVIKLKTGGAATMITSSRAIAVSYGESFSKLFTSKIFELQNNDFKSLGDAHLEAKHLYGNDSNHLKVNFLGDPAMKLSRPKPLIKIDPIDSPTPGQLRALDFVKITGSVNKPDGSTDEGFDGKLSVSIFYKMLDKKTLSKDLSYQEEGSAIVKTAAKVEKGKFTAEFYVPKGINYTPGEGRLLAYADNFETARTSAHDVYLSQPVTIGGFNANGISDSQPPKVNLFLNNTNFVDGGITNQNPMLLACITDDTGINSTGAGIGHDITVILDGEIINTTVLNDFFAAGEGNGCTNASLKEYQKGTVTYPFRNLKPGNHQLVFKVWDINNNSTTATLNFVVKDEAEQKLILNKLLNWPNPFTDKTYIQFEHNCDDILDVNVQIYTITGKLVRTLSAPVSSVPFLQGFRTPVQAIEWDGKDDFGDAVGKGTYIYKVFAKSQNQDKCKGGATAVEKMVILK